MSAGADLLAFSDASVGYGARAVVKHVDFVVRPGEVVGLVGPNGAGKSTLLRAVSGSAALLAGSLHIAGNDSTSLGPRERARLVGVVPQTPPVAFAFTARRFVEMGRHPHRGSLQELTAGDVAIVDEAMALTDTARLAAQTVDTLSGGDLQRLTVAQALAQRPRVLLLDEATAHLDINHSLQVLDLVRRLADEGLGVLGVFHDLDMAARYSDRIAIVANAATSEPVPPPEALDARVLSEVFDVRAVVRTDPATGAVTVVPIVRGVDVESPTRGPVGIVCGSGTGASVMRKLALAGVRATCGALNQGDIDHSVAMALGAGLVDLPPFGEIDAAAEARVRDAYHTCVAVVVAATPFGRANVGNLRAAVASGAPLVLTGEMSADRDYSGGEATALWAQALASGAQRVRDDSEALTALLGILEEQEKTRG
ncbi:MAG: ABC transporter ATP-binding protein [Coriobacteriia bacterium]